MEKFVSHDPNSKKRSEKLWDYEILESQINNLWSFYNTFFNSTHKLHIKNVINISDIFYNKDIKILEVSIMKKKNCNGDIGNLFIWNFSRL